jgi:hypothetical protein
MRIRAAVLHEPDTPLVVEEVELDSPKDDEVLVRVAAAGVCHSDLRLVQGQLGKGRWPIVLGHEGGWRPRGGRRANLARAASVSRRARPPSRARYGRHLAARARRRDAAAARLDDRLLR